ncbi:cytidine/deoxycytidylate deaminase family protein [Myxococcota bacterium]|nr:cytidine/deoxycytidylate deaminase family protein [Myxococcota bacterium]MBU1537812.1 cytidine/deoxycytidylate deaminase family protein [Myxococcota bacterium]
MDASKRQSWNEYFMNIARIVATRSTCNRKYVGAVIVKNNAILSTGYNGSMSGAPHCHDVGCMLENGHCVATIHAEQNAIIHAAKLGIPMEGSSIYVTASPCWLCFKMIVNSGIEKIYYGEFYRDERTMLWADKLGISMEHIPMETLTLPLDQMP